jgi:acetolactate synthase-1/2/3 large subunit
MPQPETVASTVATFLRRQGVERVFSLPGGHMKPIWDALSGQGVRIITARHEAAAVHMAQAEADLNGQLAVAIVTTGPGLTNAVTGIGCAYAARSSVLVISTRPPRPQQGMGALEEVDQPSIVGPICRTVQVVSHARHVVPSLDLAISTALGNDGPAGPVFYELPTDLLGETAHPVYAGDAAMVPRRRSPRLPDPAVLNEAAALVRESRRPLLISGRGALDDRDALVHFTEVSGVVYLDTRASRDGVSSRIASYAPALRARAMAEADLVITAGRVLDFEVAYGSPAIYLNAKRFLRIGRDADEVMGNRRGDVEVRGDVGLVLSALADSDARPADPDHRWLDELRTLNAEKEARFRGNLAAHLPGEDRRMHPYALISAVNQYVDDQTIVIADGGDILSWARTALRAPTYMDLGPFGCLGVGVPFAVSAAVNFPDRRVIAVVGDGALGFNVAELETAVRERARVVIIVANNHAWNIERADQEVNYGGRIVGTELTDCDFALVAHGLGAYGERVSEPGEIGPAIERALAHAPGVVDVAVSGSPLSADTRSGLALVPPLQALVPWDQAEVAWLQQQQS